MCAEPLAPEAVALDACYGVTRHIGIFHDGFMKCGGRVALLPSGQHLGEVALGPDAFVTKPEFLLHPVFLDCATIVPLFPLHDRLDQASLFIPFAIDEFQAVAFTGRRDVRVLVEPLDPGAGAASCCATASGSSTARDINSPPFGISRSRRCVRCRTYAGCWRRA